MKEIFSVLLFTAIFLSSCNRIPDKYLDRESVSYRDQFNSDIIFYREHSIKPTDPEVEMAVFGNVSDNEAVIRYSNVISYKGYEKFVYCFRGERKEFLADIKGALSDYTKAIEIDPQYFWAYYLRGVAKSKHDDYSGAIADLTKAIDLNVNSSLAYFYRGIIKYDHKDFDSAILDFTKYIESRPYGISKGYFNRGIVNYRIGKLDEGCSDLSKAGELGYGSAYEVIKLYCQ